MNPVSGRRQPRQKRSLEKVETILDAVETLVARDGVEALTTTAVAKHSGMAVGTIYQYFSNRTEMALETYERMFERLAAQIEEEAVRGDHGKGADDPIRRLIFLYLNNAENHPGFIPLLQFARINRRHEEVKSSAEEKIEKLVNQYLNLYLPELDSTDLYVVRHIVLRLLRTLVDAVLLQSDPELRARFSEELVEHCKFAIERARLTLGDVSEEQGAATVMQGD
ncbi:TetR/AcrR family transcriptional regulator [Hoeflea sp. CAU 1731]